eukprot:gene14145-18983_t
MEDSNEQEQAILDWVNTFEDINSKCARLSQLCDGILLSEILNEICPSCFERETLDKEARGNVAIAANNLRKILRMLDVYFVSVLKKRIDMSNVNVNAIASNHDPADILNILELVVGVAVMCEDKAKFIRNIFLLDIKSQTVLKGLIEQVLGRAEDLDDDEVEALTSTKLGSNRSLYEDTYSGSIDGISTAIKKSSSMGVEIQNNLDRANEVIRQLTAEKNRLNNDVHQLEITNQSLKNELNLNSHRVAQKEQEREFSEGTDRSRALAAETLNYQLQAEMDDLKRELQMMEKEKESLRNETKVAYQRLEASREIQAKLEMETVQQGDELDILRDKANKLLKAEQSIEKYQKKLEDMNALKKQNKEFNDKMDQYLDQIHELESQLKGISTMNKMVEQYKNKAVELEREKFEIMSSSQTKDLEITRLSGEVHQMLMSKRSLEDEIDSLRSQLTQFMELNNNSERGSHESGDAMDSFEVETVSSLKEKVKKLERELKVFSSKPDGVSEEGQGQKIALLEAELEDVRRIKKDREDALLAMKKQVSDMQLELTKSTRALADSERNAGSTVQLKEVTQKLAETSNTVRLLEEKLKEKESVINKLEQDKGKLENYTKRSLATFKEKFMDVMQSMKEEKQDLELRLKQQTEKMLKNQETWYREERLLSSAIFE